MLFFQDVKIRTFFGGDCNKRGNLSLLLWKAKEMTRAEVTEFYREHNRALYNTALRILGDSGEAEEVMQDTILKFLSAEGRFDAEAQVRAWLKRTCIRAAIDRLRERRRREAFLEDYAAAEEMVEEEGGGLPAPDAGRIREAMMRLGEPYRLVLTLVLLEGLDYAEIAEMTGKKEVTLRSLYSRGRVKLAAMLKKEMNG